MAIGVIRVPGFFQPAHSNNVSVRIRALFHCLNVSQLVAGASLQDGSRKDIIQINILGDVRAQLWAFHMNLLKINSFTATCLYFSGYQINSRNQSCCKAEVLNHFCKDRLLKELIFLLGLPCTNKRSRVFVL